MRLYTETQEKSVLLNQPQREISSSRHPAGLEAVSKTSGVIFHLYFKIINHATKIPFNTTSRSPIQIKHFCLPPTACASYYGYQNAVFPASKEEEVLHFFTMMNHKPLA